MKRHFQIAVLLFSLGALSLHAQLSPSIAPAAGTTAGGEVVTIKGEFGNWPPSVLFGTVHAPSAERIDATTIRAVTPPHLPGTVRVFVFDYDMYLDTGLDFTFEGPVPEAYERVLLPIYTLPVFGAHGSEFRSELRVMNAGEGYREIEGLRMVCPILCPVVTFALAPGEEMGPDLLDPTGRPGAFIYRRRDQRNDTVLQLRAYDVSRAATNFGTQIPVVGGDELRKEPIHLLGVPTDSRFRNTLRIYATHAKDFRVVVSNDEHLSIRDVTLQPGLDLFDPAFGVLTDFPSDVGPVQVWIFPNVSLVGPPTPDPDFWAFITVTNNDTQHITVISPQR
jgi:hypothetical protein